MDVPIFGFGVGEGNPYPVYPPPTNRPVKKPPNKFVDVSRPGVGFSRKPHFFREPRKPVDTPVIDYPAQPPNSGQPPSFFRGPFGFADPFAWETYWNMRKRPSLGRPGGPPRKKMRFTRRRRTGRQSVVTKYLNKSMVYSRRPMPRYRKRRYMKRVRFVKRVINSDLAAKTFLWTSGGLSSVTATATTCQGFLSFMIYGSNGSTGSATGTVCSTGDQDLFNMYSDITGTTSFSKLVQIRGAVMDVSIFNPDANFNVYLDIYKVVCRKDCAIDTVDTPNVTTVPTLFIRELGEQATLPTTNALGINTWPTTLFDNSGFCRYFKIISKVRSQIEPGALIQLQLKSRTQRLFTLEDIEDKLCLRYFTQGYIILYWGTPQVVASNFPGAAAVSWNVSRRYRVSVMNDNAIAAGYQVLH